MPGNDYSRLTNDVSDSTVFSRFKMEPTGSGQSGGGGAAAAGASSESKNGNENDALLGWGRGRDASSKASNMIPSTVGRGKGSKLTGGSGDRGGSAKYTEGPLGSGARSRMASYDSATTLGLPRCGDCGCV